MLDHVYMLLDALASFVSSFCDLMNHRRSVRRLLLIVFPISFLVLVAAATVVSAVLFAATLLDSAFNEDVRTLWNEPSLREKVAAKP